MFMTLWSKHRSKVMTKLSIYEIDLLEEFVEELAPRHISQVDLTTTLPAELVKVLYHIVVEKLACEDLPSSVRKSLKEVS